MFAERLNPDDKRLAVAMGAMLMAATYFAFSVRTLFLETGAPDWLSAKRLVATATGAAAFVLIARLADRISLARLPLRMLAMGTMIAASIGVVLSVRIGWDLLFSDATTTVIEANVRWVITWLGYFLAALVAFVLLARSQASYAANAGAQRNRIATVADEVSLWSHADRKALLHILVTSTQYEEADPLR